MKRNYIIAFLVIGLVSTGLIFKNCGPVTETASLNDESNKSLTALEEAQQAKEVIDQTGVQKSYDDPQGIEPFLYQMRCPNNYELMVKVTGTLTLTSTPKSGTADVKFYEGFEAKAADLSREDIQKIGKLGSATKYLAYCRKLQDTYHEGTCDDPAYYVGWNQGSNQYECVNLDPLLPPAQQYPGNAYHCKVGFAQNNNGNVFPPQTCYSQYRYHPPYMNAQFPVPGGVLTYLDNTGK